MVERPKRPKESGPLSGLTASIQLGGHKAGSAPRRRYYDPGAHPAPPRIPAGATFAMLPAKDSDRALKKQLKAERGITTGRQLKKAMRALRARAAAERDALRKRALVEGAGVVVDA